MAEFSRRGFFGTLVAAFGGAASTLRSAGQESYQRIRCRLAPGRFIYILHEGRSQLRKGQIVFASGPTKYTITDEHVGPDGPRVIAGVAVGNLVPGHYGFIQVRGPASVLFRGS